MVRIVLTPPQAERRLSSATDYMFKHSVVIVEDDPETSNRFVDLVSADSGFELLGTAATVKQGLELIGRLKPDILLTDLGLPDGSGIDIIKSIRDRNLDTQVIVITGFQDEKMVFSALEAGAKGYILKHDQSSKITESIYSMLKGGAPISPIIARLLLKQFEGNPQSPAAPEVLTERQTKILKLVSQGFSSREISEKLSISYHTVTTHIKNIYEKLQVNSRTEALHEAFKLGLLK